MAPAGRVVTARERILAEVRRALKRRQRLDDSVVEAVAARLARRRPLVQPRYDEDPTARLLRKHEELQGTAARAATRDEVVQRVMEYLDDHGLPRALLTSDVDDLNGLPWPEGVRRAFRDAQADDDVIVTMADAAIAETATIVVASSRAKPASHNYLPEHHLVVVRESTIVRWQEDAWTLLRARRDFPPRAVAMISGPSKTADVEQTIEYGAHGPRRLHVVLWDDRGDAGRDP